jgi:hypothetical protein
MRNGVTYKPDRGRGRIRTTMLDHSATEQRAQPPAAKPKRKRKPRKSKE